MQRIAQVLGWPEDTTTAEERAEIDRRIQAAAREAVAYYGEDRALRAPVTRQELLALHGM